MDGTHSVHTPGEVGQERQSGSEQPVELHIGPGGSRGEGGGAAAWQGTWAMRAGGQYAALAPGVRWSTPHEAGARQAGCEQLACMHAVGEQQRPVSWCRAGIREPAGACRSLQEPASSPRHVRHAGALPEDVQPGSIGVCGQPVGQGLGGGLLAGLEGHLGADG